MQKPWEMTETLTNGYSYESTQWELSYEYPQELVVMTFVIICFFLHWRKVTSAAKGFSVTRKVCDPYICGVYTVSDAFWNTLTTMQFVEKNWLKLVVPIRFNNSSSIIFQILLLLMNFVYSWTSCHVCANRFFMNSADLSPEPQEMITQPDYFDPFKLSNP